MAVLAIVLRMHSDLFWGLILNHAMSLVAGTKMHFVEERSTDLFTRVIKTSGVKFNMEILILIIIEYFLSPLVLILTLVTFRSLYLAELRSFQVRFPVQVQEGAE